MGRKQKKLLQLILASIVLFLGLQETAAASHPARAIMELYDSDLVDRNTIEPYIVSVLALNEVENNRNLKQVEKFIDWYFSRLNYPDRFGLTGTIYIRTLHGGLEQATHKYDSVDGYAGLFLHLLQQYVNKTGDVAILHNNWAKIEDIAYLLPLLQDKDGLTRALPDSRIKYLMDNCEAYGGVTAYIALCKITGKGNAVYYNKVRDSMAQGIWARLYDAENKIFDWAVEETYLSKSSWHNAYPDAFAQLFPIYYDLLTGRPVMKNHLWQQVNSNLAARVSFLPIEQQVIYNLTKKKLESAVAQ
ncbi:hypothetical protein SATMO3_27590 [Sporomusa aerivorans]